AAGSPRGPLGGLPVTVKSAIEVAGLRSETGSRSRAGAIASEDAVVVARLRAAGAIVLGTTNVADMLMAYESDNPLHGRTSNPWALDRTPGGSSGGEAAAIASGCSAGGIGSDGGGSIRVPAHFAGICGLKPTPGRIPGTGHQQRCLGPFSLIGVVGPMARTVGDLDALFRAMAGWEPGDPMGVPVLAGPLEGAERRLPILEAVLARGPWAPRTTLGFIEAWIDRDHVRADLLQQMDAHRVLVCPVAAVPAFRHGERGWTIDGVS